MKRIGLGGGCHWCTEAVFQSLKGVNNVEQGYIISEENEVFSEGVIVHYDESIISLRLLIEIHLNTHKSTSSHSFRHKYRSAIYTYNEVQYFDSKTIIDELQSSIRERLVTTVHRFKEFKFSRESIQNYYKKNPYKPFCETFINPKLNQLLNQFTKHVEMETLKHLIK